MARRGNTPTKENKFKMHFAKLETKKREQVNEHAKRKQYWDSNAEWQKKKKIMKEAKVERKRKKREQGGRKSEL